MADSALFGPIRRLASAVRRLLAGGTPPGEWRGGAGPLAVAWLTCTIGLPIAQAIGGARALTIGVTVTVLLQAGLAMLLLQRAAGARRALWMIGAVVALGWAFEAVGSRTGFPFGAYHYTDRLQPQLLGVPVLIPLAWLMMMPPAWAVAGRIAGGTRRAGFVVVSALAFTAWDLFLDPQMVLWGLWVWDPPGAYFGVPLANFVGWLLASGLITALARPPALPARPLLLVYTATWLLETIGLALFWGQVGPAACGFLGMGLFVLLAWRRA